MGEMSERTDWEALYSGESASDARMEVVRLTCKECGGFQESCIYEDEPEPPAQEPTR
jgi:hypothetical protein